MRSGVMRTCHVMTAIMAAARCCVSIKPEGRQYKAYTGLVAHSMRSLTSFVTPTLAVPSLFVLVQSCMVAARHKK